MRLLAAGIALLLALAGCSAEAEDADVVRVAAASNLKPALVALAPLLPFSAFSGTASGLAMRQHRFRLLALRVLAGQPLALAAGLLAAERGLGAQLDSPLVPIP